MSPFTIHEGVSSDLEEMVSIWCEAMSGDIFWRTMMGDMSQEQIRTFVMENIHQRIDTGPRLKASKTYKVIDESTGKIAAWTGLAYPLPPNLTEAQKESLKTTWEVPSEANVLLRDWYVSVVGRNTANHGYDRTKHFHRQGSMVDPNYQRQGLMGMLTDHCNAVADAANGVIYASARPNAAKMFFKGGFKVKEWIDLELGDFDERVKGKGELNSGKTRFWTVVREAGAKSEPGRNLVWDSY